MPSPRAVFARCLSALKEERVAAAKVLKGPSTAYRGSKPKLVEAVRRELYSSKICAYAQGFQLMAEAQKEYNWTLDFGTIAAIWRGGCILLQEGARQGAGILARGRGARGAARHSRACLQ